MARWCKLFGALLLLVTLVVGDGFAQDNLGGSSTHLGSYPVADSHANVDIYDKNGQKVRTISIHRENPDPRNPVGRYYHRPILARMQNPVPQEGFPDFVFDVDTESNLDGLIELEFRVLLSSKEFRDGPARDAVAAPSGDLKYVTQEIQSRGSDAEKVRPPIDLVQVQPWPIEEMIVQCVREGSSEVLSTQRFGPLGHRPEVARFRMGFAPAVLLRFVSLASRGQIAFRFYYTYTGVKASTARMTLSGAKNIWLAAKEELSSQQLSAEPNEQAPIFQDHKNKVERRVRMRIVSAVYAEHSDLVPMLDAMTPQIMARLFQTEGSLSFEDLRTRYPAAQQQLSAYLMPLLEQLLEEDEVSDIEVLRDSNTRTSLKELGGGLGFSFKGISIGFTGSGKSIQKKLKELEKTHGVLSRRSKSSQRFEIHQIRVFGLSSGWNQVELEQDSSVFLRIGEENRYLPESPVPQHYSESLVQDWLKREQPSSEVPSYTGIHLGMMLPYFGSGKEPPQGYVWADGKTSWPDKDWVPKHLRGQAVPNMNGIMIGGTSTEEAVGTLHEQGKLVLEEQQLPADGLRVENQPSLSKVKVLNLEGSQGMLERTRIVPLLVIKRTKENSKGVPPPSIAGTITAPKRILDLAKPELAPTQQRVRWIIRVE